jgi:putative spermidine/putrescine transport system substrate-binding protein
MIQAPKPPFLRVLCWPGIWQDALRQAVSDTFEKKTGIRVTHVPNVGLRLPDHFWRSLKTGKEPLLDVVWCNTAVALKMAAHSYCAPLDELTLEGALRKRATISKNNELFFVEMYAVHYVLVFQKALYPNRGDVSWSAMFDPALKGKIALYPGGNGIFPIAQILGGGRVEDIPTHMEPCWRTVERIRGQILKCAYSKNLKDDLREKKIGLCFRALPNALEFIREGLDVDWAVPEGGTADTTDAMLVPRGVTASRHYWAAKYIAHALDHSVQRRWCGLLGTLPTAIDAGTPEVIRNCPRLPDNPDDLSRILYIPETVKAKHEDAWSHRFDALTSQKIQ